MRRFAPLAPRRSTVVRLILGAACATVLAMSTIQAQIPGRNVNMVSGTKWPEGDPFLQRQNEPSIAASTRNPLHLLGGSNDYRTVDVPGMPDGEETGDAWLGLFKSTDGGQRWISTLLPGYPQDQSPAGLASPLKNYQAGADAVVRAGTNGLIYYSGLVFDRAEDGKSGVFLARFIDNNNQEAGDPIAYLGTKLVASSNGAKFLDKPWMAVDIPRNNAVTCTVTSDNILATAQDGRRRKHGYDRDERHDNDNNDRDRRDNRNDRGRRGRPSSKPPKPVVQKIAAGAVYVAYSSITGDAATLRSEILITRSMDCGNTWSAPIKVSRPEDAVNQGSTITIDPKTGAVFVGWRRFDPDLTDNVDLDAIMVARLPFGATRFETPTQAHKFPKPTRRVGRKLHRLFEHRDNRFKDIPANEANENLDQFDLGTTGYNFRTNAYPTMAADGTGRIYIAWTQRGYAADPTISNGTVTSSGLADGARIVIATTKDARTFTSPRPVDNHATPGRGHQLMPSMAFAGGKLMLVFYDLRDSKANTHNRISSDFNTNTGLRQTIDIRSAMASPGDNPAFEPSVKVSDYLMGFNPESGEVEELQVNPPNLPMFKQGTVPFIGDYIDVAAAPAFVPGKNGKWEYNTANTGEKPLFHAVWTDNRDVRPPKNGEWWNYTPAKMSPDQLPSASIYDPTLPVPQCIDGVGNPGSRNQNVYSARITGGLLVGSPGNAKPLSPDMQRGFVVFAQNTSKETKSFRMTILSQPVGGRASFEQFPLPPYTSASPAPETAIEMIVPPLSTASRTVYVTSTDPKATLSVDVSELTDLRLLADKSLYPTAPEKTAGLEARVVLNPDIENPDIENPDIENPDIENPDIENAEVYNPDIENPDIENPDIENPDIENPDIENPDIENPDIENPDIENVRVANPDIENPDIENPDIENPDIENPDIENPDIENPDIENGAIADITWKVTNDGNTTASFNVNLFLAQQTLPTGVKTQLVLLKTYRTPVTVPNGCQLGFQTRNILLANIRNPILVPPGGGTANANDPAETNATLWLAPGEEGRIVLRVIDEDTSNNVPITKANGDVEYVDPSLVPTEDVSPKVQQQAVNSEDAEGGATVPPAVPPPAPPATDDTIWTSPGTPVRVNVLANDAALFGSTKIVSTHTGGLAQNMGGSPQELVFMPTTGLLYVGGARSVGVVDPASNHLVARLPIDPSDPGASYGRVSPATGIVFFRMGGNGQPGSSLYAYDGRPTVGGNPNPNFNKPVTISPANDAAINALGNAYTFTLGNDGTVLYYLAGVLSGNTSTATLAAIDADPTSPSVGSIIWQYPLPANARPLHIVQNPASGKLYIAAVNVGPGPPQGGVFVMNPAAPAAPTKIPGVDPAISLAVNPATNLVFSAGALGSFRVNAIDGATDTLLNQLAVPSGGTRSNNAEDRMVVHYPTGKVYLRGPNQVFVVDGLKGSPTFNTAFVTLPVGPEFNNSDLVVNQATGVVVSTGNFIHGVTLIDTATNVASNLQTPRAIPELVVDPATARVFASDFLNSVHQIDTSVPAVTSSLALIPQTGMVVPNPVTNRAYVSGADELSNIFMVSGSGLLGTLPTLSLQKGLWGLGARHDASNSFFFVNNASDVAGGASRPGALVKINGATDTVTDLVATIGQPLGMGVNQSGQVIVAGSNGINALGAAENGKIRVHEVGTPSSWVDADTSAVVPLNPTAPAVSYTRQVVTNPDTNLTYVQVQSGSNTSVVYLPPAVLPGVVGPVVQPITLPPAFGALTFNATDRVEVIRTLVLGPGNSRVFLGTFNGSQYKVVALDGNNTVVGAYAGGGHSRLHTASWLEVNPNDNSLFVVDYNADNVTKLDGATLAVQATTPLPDGPSATAFNVSLNRLYVSSVDSKTITALNGSSLAVVSSVKLPLHAFFLAVNEPEGRIYTTGGSSPDESGAMVISDVAGQLGAPVSVTSATNGGGTTTVNAEDYSITYQPALGFSGTDTFTYTAHTAAGDSTATVTVNVIPVTASPVAIGDAYATPQGVPLNIGGRGVLANDAVSGTATAAEVTGLPGLTLNANGSFDYVPTGAGAFQFQYLAVDGANSNVATVSINVIAAANPLIVVNTNDSGPGSLRAAMTYANSTPGPQTITFAIPGLTPAAPGIINLLTPLPGITESVVIDGTSQWSGGLPLVEVSGGGTIGLGFWTDFDKSLVEIRGLAITRFAGLGIQLLQADTAPNNTGHIVSGNTIGTDRFGSAGKGNGTGIEVRRDDSMITGNTISGNAGPGLLVRFDADDVVVLNNVIGLSPANNTVPRPNAAGIRMMDSVDNVIIDSNIIAGNAGYGIDIQDSLAGDVTGTMIIANRIGLNQSGNPVPNGGGIQINNAPGTQIGIAGNGNIIGGNSDPGFTFGGPGIRVIGSPLVVPTIMANRIGTDPTGQQARPNRWEGIVLEGRANVGGYRSANEGNLISGNGNIGSSAGTGIQVGVGSNGSVIRGNTIGLTAAGANLGNGYSGITVAGDVSGITIGGDDNDLVNTISGNPAAGITLYSLDGGNPPGSQPRPREIEFQGNNIYNNGGQGIDLDNNGVTANDAGDTDPLAGFAANDLQNFPVLTSAINNGGQTQVNVDLSTLVAGYTYRVRFFASTACDPSGNGEGQAFIGVADIVQPGGSANLPTVPAGQFITATATDSDGNTSEFSACREVTQVATVAISDFAHIFDGAAKPATVVTNPAGLAVSVTYNGSPAAPSAIGAYTVLATVTAPGYTGSASVNQTIASTLPVGGAGGAPFSSACAPGVFANGVSPSTDSWYGLQGSRLLCSMGANPPAFVGALGVYLPTNVTCGAGEVMVGLHGMAGAPFGFGVVETMGPRCQPTGGGGITDVPAAGGGWSPTNPFSLTCPAGQAVTGVVGGVGEVVDSIALVCAPVPVTPTITAATPGTIATANAGQMIWLTGANLPGAGPADIIIKSGLNDYPAQYTWTAGSDLVIARFIAAIPNGPATIRVKAPGGSPVSNEFPITISTTPSAPIATGVYAGSCGGGFTGPGSISNTPQGGGVVVGAKGIDTTGAKFKWTPLTGGLPQSVSALSACGGPNNDVHVSSTVPLAYGPGTVLRLEITTTVNGVESPVSNAFILTVNP